MASSITDQQSIDADLQIGEPHFDQEATLLSARRVVPIRTVTARPRLKRSWALGLALTGALLMGVIATAFYYTRLKTESLTGQTISSGAEASSTLSNNANGSPESVAGLSVEPAPARARTSTESVKKSKTVARRVTNTDDQLRKREQDTRYAEGDRTAWRAERREAKERQRQERDARGIKPSDELLRIREIFEGRRKP